MPPPANAAPPLPRPPRLLIACGLTPARGQASAQVLLRHAERFRAENWPVTVLCPEPAPPNHLAPLGVRTLSLPRRFWHPPVRSYLPGSTALRAFASAANLKPLLSPPPDIIVGASGQELHLRVALGLARTLDKPFHLLMHDWWPDFSGPREHARLLRLLRAACVRSATVWTVSPELAAAARACGASRAELLPPIGGDTPSGPPPAPASIRGGCVAFFGSFGAAHAPVLAAVARHLPTFRARLLVVTRQHAEARVALGTLPGVEVRPPFETAAAAVEHARTRCSAVLVASPMDADAEPWIRRSFPSKFVEFVHTGLPVLLVAPPESSLGAWAAARRWPSFSATLGDTDLLDALTVLANFPQIAAAAAARLADGDFHPARIHGRFAAGLSDSLPSSFPSIPFGRP